MQQRYIAQNFVPVNKLCIYKYSQTSVYSIEQILSRKKIDV